MEDLIIDESQLPSSVYPTEKEKMDFFKHMAGMSPEANSLLSNAINGIDKNPLQEEEEEEEDEE